MILLVGEDNPHSAEPHHALFPYPPGCAGHRLQADILGLTRRRYMNLARINLCNPTWDPMAARLKAATLIAWSVDRVDEFVVEIGEQPSAEQMRRREMPDITFSAPIVRERLFTTFIMLGRRVTSAFGFTPQSLPFFRHTEGLAGQRFLSMPHPSGRCRQWNSYDSYSRTLRVLREIAPDMPWGEAFPECWMCDGDGAIDHVRMNDGRLGQMECATCAGGGRARPR